MSDTDWIMIEYDPVLNRATFGRDVPGGMELKTEYYVDDVLEANKAQFNLAQQGWSGDWHKIATISPALAYGDGYIASALREGDEAAISRWLNDSDNRAWRTKGGNV